MTDTALQIRTPAATTASAECSKELWQLLTAPNFSFFAAVNDVADKANPGELEAAAARLEQHAQGCGAKAVVGILTPLVTLYGLADRHPNEWKAFWKFYIDVLADCPLEAVQAGVAKYVATPTSEFFPKPGPLRALVDEKSLPLRTAVNRAARALEVVRDRQTRSPN